MPGFPAARIDDLHSCPQTNPPPSNAPHVGGKIMLAPTNTTVFIGGKLAATVGSLCVCTGPPDMIKEGSSTVKIAGQAAARVGDPTQHQGKVTTGFATVMIG